MLAYANILHYILHMTDTHSTNALRLLQAADVFKAELSGEFSSVHGLSVNEFMLMLHLDTAPMHRLARVELAKRMHVNASTITRMVAPMEKIGLLDRQTHERDARLSFVVLTKTGRTRLSEARDTFTKRAEKVFDDRWDKAELDQLSAMLHRLTAGSTTTLT